MEEEEIKNIIKDFIDRLEEELKDEIIEFYESGIFNWNTRERENIRNFYVNCPSGYEVDHIDPISSGGNHELSNLHYITKEENRKKGNPWHGMCEEIEKSI